MSLPESNTSRYTRANVTPISFEANCLANVTLRNEHLLSLCGCPSASFHPVLNLCPPPPVNLWSVKLDYGFIRLSLTYTTGILQTTIWSCCCWLVGGSFLEFCTIVHAHRTDSGKGFGATVDLFFLIFFEWFTFSFNFKCIVWIPSFPIPLNMRTNFRVRVTFWAQKLDLCDISPVWGVPPDQVTEHLIQFSSLTGARILLIPFRHFKLGCFHFIFWVVR